MIATSGIVRNIVLAAAIVTAGGCGYQLRGSVSLPPDLGPMHVVGPRDLGAAVIQLLDGAGVQVEPADGSADGSAGALVRLGNERFDRRVLSVNPETGKESEFELAYQVTFEVTRAEGEVLVPRETVSLLRDYVFDVDEVLGKSREQSVLRDEMRRDAATRIVRRIETSLGQ